MNVAQLLSAVRSRDEELEYDEEEDVRPPVRSLADKLGLTPPSRKSRATPLGLPAAGLH